MYPRFYPKYFYTSESSESEMKRWNPPSSHNELPPRLQAFLSGLSQLKKENIRRKRNEKNTAHSVVNVLQVNAMNEWRAFKGIRWMARRYVPKKDVVVCDKSR